MLMDGDIENHIIVLGLNFVMVPIKAKFIENINLLEKNIYENEFYFQI